VLAIVLGLSLGVPLAVIGDRALRREAGREVTWLTGPLVAAGVALAVLVAGILWLLGLGVWAFALALASIALLAAVRNVEE
jgi:hypothetical protein